MSRNPFIRFFHFLWRVADGLRRAVHLVLMLLVLLLVVALLSRAPILVPQHAALVIAPAGMLVEQLSGDPFARALARARSLDEDEALVQEIVDALDRAREDRRIRAVVLDTDRLAGGGLVKLQQVADALARFRQSGKPVIATGGAYGQPQMLLAAEADEVYIHPLGGVFLPGLAWYRTYFAAALEKLSIDWHVFRVGEYKSAYDPFVRNDMAPAEAAETRRFLDQLWSSYREDLAAARNLEPQAIQDLTDRYLQRLDAADGDTARLALEAGLVDQILDEAAVDARVQELVGAGGGEDEGYPSIDYQRYLAATRIAGAATDDGRPHVGVIVAAGNILPGDQPPGTIGDESLSQLLRTAREDADIKALVLRIDSGGGSQFASEVILSEMARFRDSGKPLVVSMGDLAASGGYLMALGADEIWAHPDTLTGSIGVVAMFPTFHRALARLGVTVDGVGTTRYSGEFMITRPLGEDAQAIIQRTAEHGYERFIADVATARELDPGVVRRLAGGRVWTGSEALERGLVDALGGLEDAIAAAAERAGLGQDYGVQYLEKKLTIGEALAIRLSTKASALGLDPGGRLPERPAGRLLDALAERAGAMLALRDPRNIYYHCLCGVDWTTPTG